MRAVWGMYPFPHLWPSYQRLYGAVASRLPWLPSEVEATDDVHASWQEPDVVVGQACGYPAAVLLRDKIQVFGAFHYDVPHAEGPRYRSVLVARRPGRPADFADALAAANSPESLSGYVSLTAAIHGAGAVWHEPVIFTGSHRASLEAAVRGEAEIASIDGVSLMHFLTENPLVLEGLHRVGVGPLVPTLPLYTSVDVGASRVAALQAAFAEAVHDPELAADCRTLRINGFSSLVLADYDDVAGLATGR